MICWHFSVQSFDHISVVSPKGFNVWVKLSNPRCLDYLAMHCNSQFIATITFALGTDQIQFESGPMQFLLKIDCCQQSWRSVWKQKIHFNEMEMNCTVSSLTERSVKFVCKTNKLLRRWTTLIGVTQTRVALRRSLDVACRLWFSGCYQRVW